MNNISAQTTTTTMMENQRKLVSHADESWILNDGQNNMYAAILALGDPSKQKLAETTWGQAVAAYQDSVAQLAKLRGVIRDPSAKVRLRAIDASLASYKRLQPAVASSRARGGRPPGCLHPDGREPDAVERASGRVLHPSQRVRTA